MLLIGSLHSWMLSFNFSMFGWVFVDPGNFIILALDFKTCNQAMKFGQLIEYNVRNVQNGQNEAGRLFPDPWFFLKLYIRSKQVVSTLVLISHNKREDSLETRVVYIEIIMVFWNIPNCPKHRVSPLKIVSCKEDQLLA